MQQARTRGLPGFSVLRVKNMFVMSLVIAGAITGLSGAIEVAGVQHRLIEGLQSNFLVLGIIIGLIARGNPVAVPFCSFFYRSVGGGGERDAENHEDPG